MSKSQNPSSGVIEKIQADLKNVLSESEFSLWIEPLIWTIQKKSLEFVAPDQFFAAHVKRNFLENIQKIAKNHGFKEVTISASKLPTRPVPQSLPGVERLKEKAIINCRVPKDKTFKNFVVDENNQLAHDICQMVIAGDSSLSGSIFLHGPSGSGKSHLLYATANACLSKGKKMWYISAMDFCKEYVDAVSPKTPRSSMSVFTKKYASLDILLVDEIEALGSGKPKTKIALAEIVATLSRQGGIVITTSSLSPSLLRKKFKRGSEGENLATALSGMAFDISLPNKETLLKARMSSLGLTLSEDIISYLITILNGGDGHTTNGILDSLALRQKFSQEISLPAVKKLVEDYLGEESSKVTLNLETIKKLVAENFKVSLGDLESRSRRKVHTLPRNVTMYLMRELTGHSLSEIGKQFNRSHAIVLNAHKKISEACRNDTSLKGQIELLRKKLDLYKEKT